MGAYVRVRTVYTYRLEPLTSITHAQRLARMPEPRSKRYDMIPEASEDGNALEDDRRSQAFTDQISEVATDKPFSETYQDVDVEDEEDFQPFGDRFGFGNNGGGDDDDGVGEGRSRFADEEEDERYLEELEDKQLLARIKALEAENSNITEKVWKLEHGRTWLENRMTALEAEVTALKGAPLDSVSAGGD